MRITPEPGDENPAADALNGVYEKHRALRTGDKVLDLGAHAGYFVRVARDKIGQTGDIVAFEPHPENFRRLIEHCGDLAVCVRAGAWDRDGDMDLWPAINNSGGHSFFLSTAGQEDKPIRCVIVDIGKWLLEEHWSPDFVKIDTEGAEVHILTSLFRAGVRPEIAAEIHNRELWDAACELLRRNNYNFTPTEFTNYYLYAWPK